MLKMFRFGRSSVEKQEKQPNIETASQPLRPLTLIYSLFEFCLQVIDFARLVIQTLLNWTPTSPFILEEVEQKFIARKLFKNSRFAVTPNMIIFRLHEFGYYSIKQILNIPEMVTLWTSVVVGI